jgi:hypothetical protein
MLRTGDAMFGVALGLLSMAGLATHAAPWFVVLLFIAAGVAFYLAAYGRNRVTGSGGTVLLAVVMIAASVGALATYANHLWLYWTSLTASGASLFLGFLGGWNPSVSKEPPRFFRAPRIGQPR